MPMMMSGIEPNRS